MGRISGQVIAACIRHLIDDGLLSLDDSLSLYLPEYSYAERVTIRQLLNMSSGIPDYLDNTLAEPSFVMRCLSMLCLVKGRVCNIRVCSLFG